jgi:hypothetical protein
MRWHDIISEEAFLPNPFPGSQVKGVLYHGSKAAGIEQFRIPAEGLWFSDLPTWGGRVYGSGLAETYACYVDVHNIYHPTEDEVDEYYGAMDIIGPFFKDLKSKGYDAYFQGGESGAIAVFPGTKIVNARTGKPM